MDAESAVTTADGYSLSATTYGDAATAKAGVLVCGAMGVQQRYYAGFAAWLAEQGYLVATFDYRGLGRSRPERYRRSLRGFEADVNAWARQDTAAMVDFLAARVPGRPLLWVGHSLGGQIFGLVPNRERVSAMLTVATGSGYWLENSSRLRVYVWWLWFVAVPLALRLAGYFPGRRMRKIGDLPRGVMAQWRRWCLDRDYVVGAEGEAVRRDYAAVRTPICSLSFTDDEYMSARNIESIHGFYSAAPREMKRIAPGDVGERRIGHFGFFRSRYAGNLWPLASDWLSRFAAAALLALGLAGAPRPAAAGDGLALTPPMGWNSWNKFGCDVSETLVKETADALVSSGLKDAGYEYVVIDDCWQVSREASGRIVPDAQRFPSGMKALADYVHAKGLKFGLYSDAGTGTCQKRPGSKGHELQDARTYAEWGVDYLKYDWCNTEGMDQRDAYARMSQALRRSGRPIVFSMCEWGSSRPWLWGQGVGHLWRSTGDIQDCWDCGKGWGGMGVVHIIDQQAELYPYAGPGHWNDPDMLEVGNGGLNPNETRAHFSFWALFAAPLMSGNDLRAMSAETLAVLSNREVIAVDQDPLGMQGRRVRDEGAKEVWMKPLADGSRAVILFNRGTETGDVAVAWDEIGLFPEGKALVRDLWKKVDVGVTQRRYETKVEPHGVVMLRITPQP